MNKKLIVSLIVLALIISLTSLGCSPNKTPKPSTEISKEDPKDKNEIPTAPTVVAPSQSPVYKYIISTIPSDTKVDSNTPWEKSPSGGFSATIEGKGENGTEEGYSTIIIKDEQTNNLTKLTLENEDKNKITSKDLEWIDENTMFVILGQPFGTVNKGGNIYKVNIKTGEIFTYEDAKTLKEEFTAVHKVGNVFNFEKFVYDDDNFTNGHIVNGVLDLK